MAKKLLLLFIVLLFAGSSIIVACAPAPQPPTPPTPPTPPEAPKPIRIGWTLSISGAYAAYIRDCYNGAIPLIEHINKEGGIAGHPLEVIFADTESDTTKAVLAAKRLVLEDKVHFLLGDIATGITIPVGLSVVDYGIPHIAISGSDIFLDKMKEAGEKAYHWNFIIMGVKGVLEDRVTVNALLAKKFGPKVAVLYSDTPLGKGDFGMAQKVFPEQGLEMVATASYTADATMFGPQIAAIKGAKDVDSIIVFGADFGSALCITALKEAGFTIPIISTANMITPEVLKIERVRKAYAMDPPLLASCTAVEVWPSLPDDDPRKAGLAKWNALHEQFFGETLWCTFHAYPYGIFYGYMEHVFGKLFKDQPDILDKDLATIRSAIRDYTENAGFMFTGLLMVTITPEIHGILTPGAGYLGSEYQYPPPLKYLPGYESATPPWRK